MNGELKIDKTTLTHNIGLLTTNVTDSHFEVVLYFANTTTERRNEENESIFIERYPKFYETNITQDNTTASNDTGKHILKLIKYINYMYFIYS